MSERLARTPICPLCSEDKIAWWGANEREDDFRCEECGAQFSVRKEDDRDLEDKIESYISSREHTGDDLCCPCAFGEPEQCDLDHESGGDQEYGEIVFEELEDGGDE